MRPCPALQGVSPDKERVAQSAGLLQVAKMADVQQVEDAVGEHDRFSGGAQALDRRDGFGHSHGLNCTSPENRHACGGR